MRKARLFKILGGVLVCLMFPPVSTVVYACGCVSSGDKRGVNQGCTTIAFGSDCTGGLVCEDWYCLTAGCFTGHVKACKTVSQSCNPNEVTPCRNLECAR